MITKPEDAMPSIGWIRINPDELQFSGNVFTASECAEIARAYADVCLMVEGTGKKEYLRKWQAWGSKFKEWDTK